MTPEKTPDLEILRDHIREFVAERDWDQFHTPKNLATALAVEAAELLEHFQWLQTGANGELPEHRREQVRHELADVLVYLIRLADKMDINLHDAVIDKMKINREKYPVGKAHGNSRKYSEY